MKRPDPKKVRLSALTDRIKQGGNLSAESLSRSYQVPVETVSRLIREIVRHG